MAITDTKFYAPVVTLSAQDNEKLLQELKIGFKRTIKLNKYISEPTLLTWNQYLNYLIGPGFQGLNWLFVLLFENDAHRISYKQYFLPTAEIKDYSVMTDEKNFFDQPVENDLITFSWKSRWSYCLLLLKKQKKSFSIFHKERSVVTLFWYNISIK